jgi:hypothetical protein
MRFGARLLSQEIQQLLRYCYWRAGTVLNIAGSFEKIGMISCAKRRSAATAGIVTWLVAIVIWAMSREPGLFSVAQSDFGTID